MYLVYIIIWLGLVALGGWAFLKYEASRKSVPERHIDNWNHYYAELQFSTQEFYRHVEQILKDRKIPGIALSRIEFSQQLSILSGRREYLRVKSGPYSFDICAAPYGAGFFVSWWLGEDIGCLMRILLKVPFLGPYLLRRMVLKTYYMLDTEDMFMQATHRAVTDAMDMVATTKGMRGLSDTDKRLSRRNRTI